METVAELVHPTCLLVIAIEAWEEAEDLTKQAKKLARAALEVTPEEVVEAAPLLTTVLTLALEVLVATVGRE